ncbi:type IX secretion system membrane protein PorP/SprF [Nibribacter ruber]|uniref:Type IX secretion system membrane protein PorP/SprF n=1 Tax=Nibribacter ruber TaxID=2698458 RepID=A0A6P1NY98_9BACT|nr:PorP/SprF family type IX secretion system membrane protein [Nibribacter ruber]QHL87199.1 type IX secretion system membrane protein PorP/SprF [Nibribacter ruber]
MKLKQLLAFSLLLLTGAAYGQSSSQRHQSFIPRLYHQNYFFLNPAFAGAEGKKEVGITTHLNSLGGESSTAPLSVLAYYHGAVGDTTRNGVGVVALYDQFGPYWLGKLGLSYTKRFKLGPESGLGIGAELSGKYLNVDLAEFSRIYAVKPMVGHDNDLRPDVNMGLWLNVQDFFAGATFANLLEPTFNLTGASEVHDERELYLTAGYKFTLTQDVNITPSLFLDKPLNGGKLAQQYNVLANVKMISVGATYRNGSRYEFEQAPWSLNAGVKLADRFSLLTSYDLTQEKNGYEPDPQVEASLRMKF